MSTGTSTRTDWQPELEALLEKVEAPGAVLAVMRGGEVSTWAAGIANVETGQPMTASTLFPIASVSKVYTATLVMQLVDEGLLELDRPVRAYLPDFAVADPLTTAEVTARHLLSHTSGIDGDKYDSFGRGDDALARYVADCADLAQIFRLGATFSYCNSGFIILGRLVEVLRGLPFDVALRDHLLAPLGATRAGMLPEDLIWRPLAAGHRRDENGELGVFDQWENDRAGGPAGGVVTDVGALLAFVRMHLDGGTTSDGTRVLSAQSTDAMRTPQVTLPDPRGESTHWGLGWELARRPEEPGLLGHGGDLLAHHARLVVCPDSDLAVTLLVNGDGADQIADPIFRQVLAEVGASLPQPLRPPDTPTGVDVSRVAGTYETVAVRVTLEAHDGELEAAFRIISERIAAMLPPDQQEDRRRLVPVTDSLYVMSPDDPGDPWEPVVVYEAEGQRYLHIGLRAVRERPAPA